VETSKLRGRLIVVKFFAKFCEPCTRTLPHVQALADSRSDLAVVGVAEDEREAEVRDMVNEYRLTFPVVHDRDQVLAGRYRVTELPVTVVADRSGRVRWVGGPHQAAEDVTRAVHALANE
jgi:peroxiredoxin